jgi:hypothetical protein
MSDSQSYKYFLMIEAVGSQMEGLGINEFILNLDNPEEVYPLPMQYWPQFLSFNRGTFALVNGVVNTVLISQPPFEPGNFNPICLN